MGKDESYMKIWEDLWGSSAFLHFTDEATGNLQGYVSFPWLPCLNISRTGIWTWASICRQLGFIPFIPSDVSHYGYSGGVGHREYLRGS